MLIIYTGHTALTLFIELFFTVITSALRRGYVSAGVCPSVRLFLCLLVNNVTQKFSYIVYISVSKSWLNYGDANVTVAYFKATLNFMGPLPGRRSVLYEYNSLVHKITCWDDLVESSFTFVQNTVISAVKDKYFCVFKVSSP